MLLLLEWTNVLLEWQNGAVPHGVEVVGVVAKVSTQWSSQSCCCCKADKHSGTDVLFLTANTESVMWNDMLLQSVVAACSHAS